MQLASSLPNGKVLNLSPRFLMGGHLVQQSLSSANSGQKKGFLYACNSRISITKAPRQDLRSNIR